MARHRNRYRHSSRRPPSYRRNEPSPATAAVQQEEVLEESTFPVNTALESDAEYMPALFHRFPTLAGNIPWLSLRGTIEPVVPKILRRSQHLFGENYVFLKNEGDDFHLVPEHYAKRLEFVLASPPHEKARNWVTSGRAGDLHSLALAKASRELGRTCEIILRQSPMSAQQIQAIMAMMNLGARVRLRETEKGFRWTMSWKRFLSRFFSVSIVPEASWSVEGIWGAINAFCELEIQIKNGLVPMPDYIVVPVSSGVTLVGFEIAKRLVGLSSIKIQGIAVQSEGLKSRAELAEMANHWQSCSANLFPPLAEVQAPWSEKDFYVDLGVQSDSAVSADIERWLIRFLELEQIDLDLSRAGRALYGLHRWLEKKNHNLKKVLFWNSSSPFRSGDLGIFDGYKNLPRKLQRWIKREQKEGRLYEVGPMA